MDIVTRAALLAPNPERLEWNVFRLFNAAMFI
jgi:hypothetical protein